METIKGFKVFLPDFTSKSGGMQFKENETFGVKLPISICNWGLHFCVKAQHCFSYYDFDPKNIVCEVEAIGETKTHEDDSKVCTNILKIGRRLTWAEVLVAANDGANNTGHSNSGYRNSGYWNSGDRNSGDSNSGDSNSGDSNSGDSNSGDRNSGNWNSGDRNSGDSNSGYRNSGAFCLDTNPTLVLFDKPTNILVRDWEESEAVQIMNRLLDQTMWVYASSMTEEEKKRYPKYETTDGYLKTKTMHEAWKDMWHNLGDDEKKVFYTLPNFSLEKFNAITGLNIDSKDLVVS